MVTVESWLRTGGGGQDTSEEAILSLSFSDQLGYGSLVKRERKMVVCFSTPSSLSFLFFILLIF